VAYSHNYSACEVICLKASYYDIINNKSRSEWIILIHEWVHSELDRKLLERKLLDGISFEALAEELELSTNHCQNRFKKAKEQLFNHI
jgi:hypothetical protein